MATLYYKKINQSKIEIASDEDYVLRELSDYYSFYADGYKYSPQFRNRIWDGKIRLIDLRKMTAPAGLVPSITKFCAERNYQIIDQTEPQLKFVADDLDQFDQWIKTLNLPFEPRPYQRDTVEYAIKAGRALILSSTGCHSKGTKIIMSDGSVKNVEDIKIGDQLLSVDGQSRKVLKLCCDKDQMYQITPKRSAPFVVNSEHILHLYNVQKKIFENIPVYQYLNKTDYYKHTHYLVSNKTPIEFNNNSNLLIDPYFVGLYLGDGHTHSAAITTADNEVIEYVNNFAVCNGYDVSTKTYNNKAVTINIKSGKGKRHRLLEMFEHYQLRFGMFNNDQNRTKCSDKFIPKQYLQGTIEQRFQLLAGLIDTDGYLASNSYYEYSTKSKQLADDIVFLANSLGYNCSRYQRVVNNTVYYRINILGDIQNIPVKVIRKKCTKIFNRNKDPHHQTFVIETKGINDYYGFELDGDHLYFTDNWIVNHNSGKSLNIYLLIRWHLQRGRKCVVIVPSTSLVEQMHNDFKNYAKNDKTFDVDQQVHKLYSKIKTTDPYNDQCVITTWQSIKNYDKQLFETWDCVICDEAHGLKANVIKNVLEQSINATYRYGLTGTLTGMACHEYQITGLLGSIYIATSTKDLQQKGYLSDCKIYMVDMKYPVDDAKQLWKDTKMLNKTYQDELDYVNHHPKRNLFIRNLVCSLKGTTLILFRFREHGEMLMQLIKDKIGDSRPIFHIDGRVDAKTREDIRQQLKDPNSNAILVFSVATSSTGIDIKAIKNLILSPSKSKVQTLQSIGRALRLCEGKQGAKVFDLIDDLRTGRRRNYLYNMASKRLEFYNEQGFDLIYKEVQL